MNLAVLDNPYRLFFPLAWLMGLWGGIVWLLFAAGANSYPAIIHPQAMITGFLFGHVLGFLLTAAPKFTGTGSLHPLELGAAVVSYVALCLAALFYAPATFVFFATSTAITSAILARRFLMKSKTPPAEFVFLPFGMFSAFIGALIKSFNEPPAFLSQLANLFVYEAFVLSLVIGVGSRLAPFLMGQGEGAKPKSLNWALALFWFTYFFEAMTESIGDVNWSRCLRALVVFAIFCRNWQMTRFPRSDTKQAWGLWASAWMMSVGLFASSLTTWRVHALHLFYVGGLGLLTLMVATRVTLAHGSKRLYLERTSKALYPVVGLLLVAAAVRTGAIFLPKFYIQILSIAALLWVSGLFLWGSVFLKEGSHQQSGAGDD